jgi:hypothetical protein
MTSKQERFAEAISTLAAMTAEDIAQGLQDATNADGFKDLTGRLSELLGSIEELQNSVQEVLDDLEA